MAEEQARLTIAGKLISILLVLGLIGTGIYVVSRRGIGGGESSSGGSGAEAPQTEAPDTKGVTTVSEYKYVPVDKLPPVKGTSQYKWDANSEDPPVFVQRLGRMASRHRRESWHETERG